MTEFSGNRGEWSEPYVLLKLLADGELALGDSNLNKIKGLILPILSILREERSQKFSYSNNKQNVVIELAGRDLFQIAVNEFKEKAEFLLKSIKLGALKVYNSRNRRFFASNRVYKIKRKISVKK